MTTYISGQTYKKEFKRHAVEFPAATMLRDPSIQPGSRSGTIKQLFGWGITRFTVTNSTRSWFAEVTRGRDGKAVVK